MSAISCTTAISDADADTINYTVPLFNYIESGSNNQNIIHHRRSSNQQFLI